MDARFHDAGAFGSGEDQMLDIVAAQKKESLARADRQRLDELQPARGHRLDEAWHAEAAQRQAREWLIAC